MFVLTLLLRENNVVSTSPKSMAGEYDCWPPIDKTLAVIADARLGWQSDVHAIAEDMLSTSRGDSQSINRKYGNFLVGPLDDQRAA